MAHRPTTGPRPRSGILEIRPYVAGESSVPGRNRVIKLSSNETPLGPSPLAIEAYREAAADLFSYPDGSGRDLREALARKNGLEVERIQLGNGSDELLHFLAQAYLSPGDEAICTEHSFLAYRIATLAANARPVLVPHKNDAADVDGIIAAVNPRTRLVFICNPDNPMGSYLSKAELERLHAGLPEDVMLIIDAAYGDYARAEDYAFGDFLVRRHPNVVMSRTFSKIYGLAALRIGWIYAPAPVIDVVNRIRAPFNTSRPAQLAAVAALKDQAHFKLAYGHNAQWLPWLEKEIGALGIRALPSQANFALLDFGPLGRGAAAAADEALKEEGLILRAMASYDLPDALRLTVGIEEANRAVVATLAKFVQTWKAK